MKQQKHVRFDWAIKRLLRQKANFNILEGFLSELLKDNIRILEIIDTESNQETETDKFNRVDILVKDKKGEIIIIEIQNSYAIDYFLRILFGISKAITEHIKVGDEWTSVKKVISINIVYFDLGRGKDYIYKGETTFFGLHQKDELQLSNAQKKLFKKEKVKDLYPEIYLIKVNNFDDVAKDTLDEWVYFLKNSEIKKTFTAKGLKEAEEVLKVANMEDEERREYQRFGEVLSDRASQALSIRMEIEMAIEKERKEKEAIRKEKDEMKKAKDEMKKAKDEMKKAKDEMKKAKDEMKKAKDEMKKEKDEMKKEKDEMKKEKDEIEKEMEKKEQKYLEDKKTTVINLIEFSTLRDEEIAKITGTSVEFVKDIKREMK